MCQGVNESYLLPLFLSNLSTTEICLMLLIEKQGPDISYRSRNCNKDNIPLCDVCKSTFDTLTHFHHNFLNQSCSEFENLNTKHKNVTFDETFVEALDETPEKQNGNEKELNGSLEDSMANNELHVGERYLSLKIKSIETDKLPFNKNNLKIKSLNKKPRKRKKDLQIKKEGFPSIESKAVELEEKLEHICNTCGELFEFRKDLKQHVDTSHKKPKYTCETCGLQLLYRYEIDEHKFEKHPELRKPTFSCPFCSDNEYKDKSFSKIKSHMILSHVDEKENPAFAEFVQFVKEENCICSTCGTLFTNSTSLISHISHNHKHHKILEYTCEDCGKGYETKQILQDHINNVHHVAEVACEFCGKIYQNMSKKVAHTSRAHSNDGFTCKVCYKHYSIRSNLLRHNKAAHLKQKNVICTQCDKQFSDERSLKRHMKKVHERMRLFQCEKCEYRASSLSNLNIHRSKMHNISEKIKQKDYIKDVMNGTFPSIPKDMLPVIKLLL